MAIIYRLIDELIASCRIRECLGTDHHDYKFPLNEYGIRKAIRETD